MYDFLFRQVTWLRIVSSFKASNSKVEVSSLFVLSRKRKELEAPEICQKCTHDLKVIVFPLY